MTLHTHILVLQWGTVKDTEKQLTEHGAMVRFTEYPGGHGWHSDVYGLVRENLVWLQSPPLEE